ncbi:MAG: peptidoglycan-binding protein LysM, partial [Pseudomonas sp.]
MAHVRKLLLTLASGSALYSGLVPALGLGGITLHSALNQPLEADIELLQMGDLDSGDIRVRLASEADFARSGVDRLFFLNDLRFTPLLRGNRHIIRVVSSKPVQEPYLNFVIEVARPNGQLLREYTVLLDPPSSSAYSAVAAAPVAEQPRASAARPAPVAVADLPPATQGRRYQVQRGDSLWLIARRLRDAGSSLSQSALMDGLYGLNPQAFVAGDKNRLSLGAYLLLPDAAATATATAGSVTAAPAVVADAPSA